MHKVVSLRAEAWEAPLIEPFAIAIGRLDRVRNVLITCELADGTLGYGEAAPLPAINGEDQATVLAALGSLTPFVVGKPVEEWQAIAKQMVGYLGNQNAARAGVEMALVDALAKSRGVPLWKVFGDAGLGRISTDVSIPITDPRRAGELAAGIAARGHDTVKVKVGDGVEPSVRRMVAVSRAAPGCRLIADANQGFTVDEALAFHRGTRDQGCPIDLFEQPVLRHDLSGMARVRQGVDRTPIAADESAFRAFDVTAIADLRAAQVINLKLMKSGLAEALIMAVTARTAGLALMMGGMIETRIGMACAAHLVAGLGGFTFVDLDTPLLLAEDPCEGPARIDGHQWVLEDVRKGLGVHPRGRTP